MYRKIIIDPMESLSLLLVTSFYIFHNIYIVLIGVCLSLYIINKDNNDLSLKLKKNKELDKDNIKHNSVITREINTKISKKDDFNMNLVETIEKYGFIPSIDEKD
tara:strand:+ start:90 stop:404 length:315 start_codon:yes stop_codon:yes gene_type:complete